MKATFKKLFTNVRIIILLVFLLFAVVALHPNPNADGVAIRTVATNSSAAEAGIESPEPTDPPMSRERIEAINSVPINSLADYYNATRGLPPNVPVNILTNEGYYQLETREKTKTIVLNETEEKTVTEVVQRNETVNGTVVVRNETVNRTVTVNKTREVSLGTEDIGLSVYKAPKTNIQLGLDLQGGTRVLLKPKEPLSDKTMEALIANLKQRLNIYGLTDIVVRTAGDLFSDQRYVVVEIAGANEEEVKELLSRQGKFEAAIGNKTVFRGGENDITHVCRSVDCAGIDPYRGCQRTQDGHACTFRFSISLKQEAAQRQANVTEGLDVITTNEQGEFLAKEDQYLSKKLRLFLDDEVVDELNIGASLKGEAETNIQISGSGVGKTREEAQFNALENMKQLQTILITGSLPAELEVVKSDTLSSQVGETFIKNSFLIGVLAMLGVAIVVFIRYRVYQVFMPMLITMVSEVLLILGLASFIGWNVDMAAIAGLIVAVGTGVDDQIVIADETLRGEKSRYINWKTKLKNAFYIIMAAFFTTAAAMLPLLFAGAGMLKGFAITTLFGITIGVFITRPAFGAMLEVLLKE